MMIQVIVADFFGDISHVGTCALHRRYKYIGFLKYPNLLETAQRTLTDGDNLNDIYVVSL
jgi:hypothetical protein